MSNRISHSGVIDKIDGDHVQVRIVQTSACAACKVAGYCNAAESKVKMVDVFCDSVAKQLSVGQTVTVTASRQVATQALLWAFGLPFLLMVSVLIIVLKWTGSEGLAALSGLGILVPYFIALWLFRDRMRDRLSFSIE